MDDSDCCAQSKVYTTQCIRKCIMVEFSARVSKTEIVSQLPGGPMAMQGRMDIRFDGFRSLRVWTKRNISWETSDYNIYTIAVIKS